MRRWLLGIAAISLVALTSAASADTFVINMSSLPSSQGWTYESLHQGSLTESDIYSVDGTTLSQSSMGSSFGTTCTYGSWASYVHDLSSVGSADWWELTVQVRVLESEFVQNDHFGFSSQVMFGGFRGSVGMSTTALQIHNLQTIALDGTQWHLIRFFADLNALTTELWLDGSLVWTGYLTNDNREEVRLGDWTCRGNASAEIRLFVLTLETGPVATDSSSWGSVKALYGD